MRFFDFSGHAAVHAMSEANKETWTAGYYGDVHKLLSAYLERK